MTEHVTLQLPNPGQSYATLTPSGEEKAWKANGYQKAVAGVISVALLLTVAFLGSSPTESLSLQVLSTSVPRTTLQTGTRTSRTEGLRTVPTLPQQRPLQASNLAGQARDQIAVEAKASAPQIDVLDSSEQSSVEPFRKGTLDNPTDRWATLFGLGSVIVMAAAAIFSASTNSQRTQARGGSTWSMASVSLDEAKKDVLDHVGKYCDDVTRTSRRKTRTVTVGVKTIGSDFPVRPQTMCTTDTADVEKSVEQILKVADEGAVLARLTVQGGKEAKACQAIRDSLNKKGCDVGLVADIHFTPKVALTVADSWEKIRVNPGNFADGLKKFDEEVYETREQYDAAGAEIEALFTPLVLKCKELGRAIRIGTNHGSLSARVMSFWGDSPLGMVESAVEFAKICRKHDFHNFLFSMKASNPLVMVQAYRLLAAEMYKLGWDYPLHLGVTEAGEGEDGRMKSAIGIGALLVDGLGDTVRVSLTEDPEYELAPCSSLIEIGAEYASNSSLFDRIPAWTETASSRDYLNFVKRRGELPGQLDGDQFDIRGMMNRDGSVFATVTLEDLKNSDLLYASLGAKLIVGMPFKDIACADSVYLPEVPPTDDKEGRLVIKRLQDIAVGVIAPLAELEKNPMANTVALVTLDEIVEMGALPPLPEGAVRYAVKITGIEPESHYTTLKTLSDEPLMATLILEVPSGVARVHASRRAFQMLHNINSTMPVILSMALEPKSKDELILRSGAEAGGVLVDGLGDGVMISAVNDPTRKNYSLALLTTTSFNLLQGARMRSVKTDYVSCPSCGRTLFDLQEVTEQIKVKTGHLPGVSIAIMGCIVNGPGEMADADFGYVGGRPGMVDLYVGKEVVKRNIPNAEACDALVDLIKEYDRWVEPSKEEEPEPVAA